MSLLPYGEYKPDVSDYEGTATRNLLNVVPRGVIGRGPTPPFTGTTFYGVYLDGGDNASSPAGVAPGIRYVRVLNSSAASFTVAAAFAYYAKGSRFINFDCPGPVGAAMNKVIAQYDEGNTYVVSATCPYQALGG